MPRQVPAGVQDAFRSLRFVMGQEGQETAVLIDMEDWRALLNWLEDLEDRAVVESVLPRLQRGPQRAEALRWQEAKASWDDESA